MVSRVLTSPGCRAHAGVAIIEEWRDGITR